MKKSLIFIVAGALLGVLFSFSMNFLKIDDGQYYKYYLLFVVIIFLGGLAINFLYFNKHSKKTKNHLVMLERGKPQEFIDDIEAILPTLKSKYLKNLYTVNLSAGYCDLKNYKKAKKVLKSIENQKLPTGVREIYALNLTLVYFYLNEDEKAVKLYNDSTKDFAMIRKVPKYRGNFAVLDTFYYISQGEIENAREKLEESREKYKDTRLLQDYEELAKRIDNLKE